MGSPHGTAEHEIVDVLGIHARLFDGGLHHLAGQLVGTRLRERTLAGAPHGAAYSGNDCDVSHIRTPQLH
jgi:hypothetical protein